MDGKNIWQQSIALANAETCESCTATARRHREKTLREGTARRLRRLSETLSVQTGSALHRVCVRDIRETERHDIRERYRNP
jgi:hypothetical protein